MLLLRISSWLLSLACLFVVGCATSALKDSPPGEAVVVTEQVPARGKNKKVPPAEKSAGDRAATPATHPGKAEGESSPPGLRTSKELKIIVRDSSGSPWKPVPIIRRTADKVFRQCPELAAALVGDTNDQPLLHIQIAEYTAKTITPSQDSKSAAIKGSGRYVGIARGLIRLETPGEETLRMTFKGHCRLSHKPSAPEDINAALYDSHSLVEALIAIMVERSGPQCAIGLIAQDNQQAPLARAVLIKTGQPSVAPLIKVVHDTEKNIGLRRAAVIVLGDIEDPQAVTALIGALNHSDFWIQYYAAVALIEHGDGQTISMLIEAMKSAAIYEKERIHKVLVEATGTNLGLDSNAWQQWWVVNKKHFP